MSRLSPPKRVSSIEAKVVVLGSQGSYVMYVNSLFIAGVIFLSIIKLLNTNYPAIISQHSTVLVSISVV